MSAPILHDAPVPVRAPARRAALLDLLLDLRPHTHAEMTAAGGARFGARLLELRLQDWCIETVPVSRTEGRYVYKLWGATRSDHRWRTEDGLCARCGAVKP